MYYDPHTICAPVVARPDQTCPHVIDLTRSILSVNRTAEVLQSPLTELSEFAEYVVVRVNVISAPVMTHGIVIVNSLFHQSLYSPSVAVVNCQSLMDD